MGEIMNNIDWRYSQNSNYKRGSFKVPTIADINDRKDRSGKLLTETQERESLFFGQQVTGENYIIIGQAIMAMEMLNFMIRKNKLSVHSFLGRYSVDTQLFNVHILRYGKILFWAVKICRVRELGLKVVIKLRLAAKEIDKLGL